MNVMTVSCSCGIKINVDSYKDDSLTSLFRLNELPALL